MEEGPSDSSILPFHRSYSDLPPETHAELVALYSRLCKDDTPMVRRVAALNLATLISVVRLSYFIFLGVLVFD